MLNVNFEFPLQVPRLPPAGRRKASLEMSALRNEEHPMGHEFCTVHCDEGNVRQLVRCSHVVETVSNLRQLCFMRNFAREIVGDGDVIDFLDPRGPQEPAVVLQEPPHAALVGRIPLIGEKLRSRVPPPFKVRAVNVEEQLLLVVIRQFLGFALVVIEPQICRLQVLDQLGVVL